MNYFENERKKKSVDQHVRHVVTKRQICWCHWSLFFHIALLLVVIDVERKEIEIVIPPNLNTFSDWRRTCHVSLVKTSWRPRATTTWTFDSHVIRSCTFETAANLSASRRQANNFYLCIVLFWVGRYNKTLNDWPLGKQWVLFPLGPVIKFLLINEYDDDDYDDGDDDVDDDAKWRWRW